MAKIIGVGTGWKGKVGNYLFQTWKGIQTVKTMFIPSNPQSAGQTTNRTAFNEVVQTFKALVSTLVTYFWNPFATSKQTGWGNLIGANQLVQAGGVFDPDNLILSQGSLPAQEIDGASYLGDEVTIDWTENTEAGASSDDIMFGAVYNTATRKWHFDTTGQTRGLLSTIVITETGLTVSDLKAFLICYRGTLGTLTVTDVSDSTFYQVTV